MKITQYDLDKILDSDDINTVYLYEQYYNNQEIEFDCVEHEIQFLDTLASGFANQFLMEVDKYIWSVEEKYYMPIYYAKKAIYLFNHGNIINYDFFVYETIKRIYTNLGNYYANQYRYCEAMYYYNLALRIDSEFSMAKLNKAICIEKTPYLKKCCNVNMLVNYVKDIYNNIMPEDDFQGEMSRFVDIKKSYYNSNNAINKKEKFKIDEIGLMFCLSINPIADLACNLDLLPDVHIDDFPFYQHYYKELCEDYNYINFLLACGNEEDKRLHIIAFLKYFSFFDKIAYFLNKFFDIGLPEKDVTMQKLWMYKKSQILNYKNPYLYAIYWISREYRNSYEIKQNEYIDDNYKDLVNFRNELEHRIKLIDDIDIEEIQDKVMQMQMIIRNMLVYLQLMADVEMRLGYDETKLRNPNLIVLDTAIDGLCD